jgi:hypothetical protein
MNAYQTSRIRRYRRRAEAQAKRFEWWLDGLVWGRSEVQRKQRRNEARTSKRLLPSFEI